ncbi:MAG: hypothetical protein IPK60_19595 [Sandaracinaceae bacterium]|nr:hypothetical protein [Sandaracinaceae bacterium]
MVKVRAWSLSWRARCVWGTQHACAIMTDRTMQCWGSNAQDKRGLGTTTPPFAAPYFKSVVPGMTDIDEIALDDQRTCAHSLADDVWCWGINSYGQLGDGTTTRRTSPTHVTLPSPAIDIAVSYRNTCAVLRSQRLLLGLRRKRRAGQWPGYQRHHAFARNWRD